VSTSHWLRDAGFAGVIFALVACNAQSGAAAPTTTTLNYRAEAKKSISGELLYASETEGSKVLVFSYPEGGLVETLTGFAAPPWFICSGRSGDVFVAATDSSSPGYIYQFAHGGSQPIETLTDPGPGHALSCSVDPTTGNLAVANGPNVAVYPQGQGAPTIYEASDVGAFDCAYDGAGDLFVDGQSYNDKIAELPAGGTSFSDIALSKTTLTLHLQWWNKRLVILGGTDGPHGPYEIFQVRVSGSDGIVSGPVLLYGKSRHRLGDVEFVASDNAIVMPEGSGLSLLNVWHYPKGGKPYKVLDPGPRDYHFYGVAISK
jgi:hypothetical protein